MQKMNHYFDWTLIRSTMALITKNSCLNSPQLFLRIKN